MPRYNSQLNNSLQLRGRIWHIYWNVPKSLRDNPLFRGKRIYAKTLHTADVHEARKMRDMLVKQFQGMVEIAATQASRRAFMENLADAKRARETMLPLDTDSAFVTNFAGEPVIERGGFNAIACNLPVEQEAERHTITLKEAAKRFIKEHEGKVDRAVSSSVKYATASLQRVIGSKDVKLKDVTSRQVTRWIKSIAKDYTT